MLTRFFLTLALTIAGLVPSYSAEIFPTGTTWRYLKGFQEASNPTSAWRERGFDDSGWESGPATFFYGEDQTGTLLDDMRNNYTSIFLRKTFNIADPNALSDLTLDARSDDGFIAWINGREAIRFNMPEGEMTAFDTSLAALGNPVPWESHVINNPRDYLVPGENVIAIHAFNTSLGNSGDFIFDASLSSSVDVSAPVVLEISPTARALVRAFTTVEVIFSEAVKNVDAGDLLINGVPATEVTSPGPQNFVFTFAEPAKGEVTVAFRANHGITDLAAAANAFGGFAWSYTLDPDAPVPGVMISEFMADNDKTLNDVNGDNSDWIELFNPTASSVNLNGWFLTDTTNNLTRWRIPNISIAPNSYLVIFASDKNRTNPGAQLHTNFKISKDGGALLALVDPRTNKVSAFTNFPIQFEDVSYGRERSNPTLVGYFPKPTPGSANVPGGAGFAPEVQFSVEGQTFRTNLVVSLTTSDPQAVIRYTVNGDLPVETSSIYAAPITLVRTTQLRARAFKSGLLPGTPRSENYIHLSSTVVNFTSDLPVVILHNNGAGPISQYQSKVALMQVFEPKNGVTSLTNSPDLSTRAMFRLRGSSTLTETGKGSYALEMINDFDDDEKHELLGMPAESDWVFYAPNYFEPILTHNAFMHQLSRDIGRYSPRTRFAEVYVVTTTNSISNTHYNGIYVIEEKIKRGPERVDINSLQPQHLQEPEISGGYLLKIDRQDPEGGAFYAGGMELNYVDPKYLEISAPGREAQVNYISSYIDSMANSLSDTNPSTGYRQYIDVPAWIDHHLLNVLAFNVDALRLSTYLHKPRGGKIAFGPIWDFDRALGSTDGRDENPRVWRSQVSDRGTDFFNFPWWGELFQDLEFFQEYIDRYQELRRNQFSTTNLYRLTDALANQVRRAQPREFTKWQVSPRGGSYQGEINYTKTWISNRVAFMDTQFVPAPKIVTPGGTISEGATITITPPPNSTVYYTLDGSDPRLRGGGISTKARTYSAPFTVSTNVRVFARTHKPSHTSLTGPDNPPLSSKWSGGAAATFVVQTPALVISELMYNPAPPPPGNTSTNDLYEYVELLNRGSTTLSLIGFSITNGVEYTFTTASGVTSLAAGERVVVVKNRAAFVSRYGNTPKIAGEYLGSLSKAGERMALVGPLLEPIHDFIYSDQWHRITDGPGFSLVLADEQAALENWGTAANWRASAAVHGSPGSADGSVTALAKVMVNEVLTHTDLPAVDTVELLNAGITEADISGWYLTDDFGTPKKYRLPPSSRIQPGAFMLLDEADFNVGANGFSFGSTGDDIYLFSANGAGELTGYVHGFEFGAALNGVTFGRHLTSDNREVFVSQRQPTLAAQNAGPLIGPVVISEIMFYPPMAGTNDNTQDEFIELQNISAGPVSLFHSTATTNSWRLRGVDYDFPPNITLPMGGFALIVNFDPSNSGASNAFKVKYGIASEVPLFGPYNGTLGNDGERISLQRPDAPTPGSFEPAPYVLADGLHYYANAPWPAGAANALKSLQRRGGTFADDPASWVVADPSAGKRTAGEDDPDRDRDGLPNEWELANGLDPDNASGVNGAAGDLDNDGLTNLQEFQAGTLPNNAASALRFASVVRTGNTVELSFNGVAQKRYAVWYRSALESGSWTRLADVAVPQADEIITVRDNAPANEQRFYRLELTP